MTWTSVCERLHDCLFDGSNMRIYKTSIDQQKLQTQNNTTIAHTSFTIFDSFHPVTITQLHTMIKKSRPTFCALDPMPTSLLLECIDDTIIIIMASFKCYFSGEHIALSTNKNNNGVNIAL